MALIKQKQKQPESRVIQPLVNIHETDKEVVLEAEMTGLTKEDIGLELKGNELTIKGKTRENDEAIPKGYTVIHRERCPLEYIRTFVIGDDIDKSKIDAQYENGILRVKLVKSDEAQPKRIEIKE
ncbi:MAG: Hsp20/alpha crystallin family protein [Candidatus Omnitrophota bacterium]|jgi:HSP20 family protein|nr:MAG: Hsp20/alpha crystallin family protein [Candidatus Omnitrophota bacterium]